MLDHDAHDPERLSSLDPLGSLGSLDAADLAHVAGGASAASGASGSNDFGRCGPGSSWRWLGDVYTPECRTHDAAVRGQLANGSSPFMAHFKSLPLLPAAVGSYVRERLR